LTYHATHFFDTDIGPCGITWTEHGVAAVRLIEARAVTAEHAPPDQVRDAIEAIQAIIRGEARDATQIPLDLARVGDFERRVYEITRAIPFGSTMTYGQIARQLGQPGAAQAVGQAMGRNPVPILIPCHRVLASGKKLGGFSAPGGTATKERLLRAEGSLKGEQRSLFDP